MPIKGTARFLRTRTGAKKDVEKANGSGSQYSEVLNAGFVVTNQDTSGCKSVLIR